MKRTNSSKTKEFLEKGIIIGNLISQLENNNKINFTKNMNYDTDLVKLAEVLISEFNQQNEYNYFTEYVYHRLIEMQQQFSK